MQLKNKPVTSGWQRAQLAGCLVSLGALSACGGGGGDSAPVTPPAPPSVSIDVFGARGTTLTAVVTSSNCSVTPTVSWQTSGGTSLGNGNTVQDTQPGASLIATATCSTATASETLQPNSVYSSLAAFAVQQGSAVVAWGNPVWGGQTSTAASYTNVSQVFPSERGFAVLLSDGTARAWGSGYITVSDPNATNPTNDGAATSPLTNLTAIFPGRVAYFGVQKDGSFVAWGFYREVISGNDYSMNDPVKGLTNAQLTSLTNIKSIASTEGAYAALRSDGSVVAFGDADTGGDASKVQAQLTNVVQLAGTDYDFVALRKDGTVVAWSGAYGWASPDRSQTLANIQFLTMNSATGVAVNNANVAMAFGDKADIDAADSSSLNAAGMLNNVARIYTSQTAFAALKSDGTVVGWGDPVRMTASLNNVQSALTGVTQIQSTDYAFAALKNNGRVVTWGDSGVGGDSSTVAGQLTNVVSLAANHYAFAALRSDGTVVSWGTAGKGGDSSAVATQLTNVRAIYSTAYGAFLAVKKDGSYVVWGDKWAGGTAVPPALKSIPYGA